MDVSQSSRGSRDISLETIVEKAIAMADVDGLAALSLRKIASELDVAPMTLYGYVRSKDDLLGQMASHALAAFEVPPVTSDDWTEHLHAPESCAPCCSAIPASSRC